MIYELRVYECVPGKLPALHKRFETTAFKMWAKHGIRQVGFWTALIGEKHQALTYPIEWESLAEREERWTAFVRDPERIAARAEMEKDGPIRSRATRPASSWRTAS